MIARNRSRGKYQWASTSDKVLVRLCVSAFFTRVHRVVAYSRGCEMRVVIHGERDGELTWNLGLLDKAIELGELERSWKRV
jgi:hypothetical protein